MKGIFFSSFLHLDLNDDGVEDDIQYLNPIVRFTLMKGTGVPENYVLINLKIYITFLRLCFIYVYIKEFSHMTHYVCMNNRVRVAN